MKPLDFSTSFDPLLGMGEWKTSQLPRHLQGTRGNSQRREENQRQPHPLHAATHLLPPVVPLAPWQLKTDN